MLTPQHPDRSIPAHAGEPIPTASTRMSTRVYPRPRGGAEGCRTRCLGPTGLSPSTRGSLGGIGGALSSARSIPAHAGEPHRRPRPSPAPRVYPRPRGGALAGPGSTTLTPGLSPPTRGSRQRRAGVQGPARSIPAHAGEPARPGMAQLGTAVYPRPRGGAAWPSSTVLRPAGLSPPTRGSLGGKHYRVRPPGSIPAHAGEPASTRQSLREPLVYPRPRGGAPIDIPSPSAADGLSPPTRGSLKPRLGRRARQRSIPAHAGEPGVRRPCIRGEAVYPRPRGGARRLVVGQKGQRGLSPPTRGSRRVPGRLGRDPRSIPAHAGEPQGAGRDVLGR